MKKERTATNERPGIGIPKPSKQQESIEKKLTELKNDEKTWKKLSGIKTNTDLTTINNPFDTRKTMTKHKEESFIKKKIPEIKFKGEKTPAKNMSTGSSVQQVEDTKAEKVYNEIRIAEEKNKIKAPAPVMQKRQLIILPVRDEKKEEEEFQKELKETEIKAEEEAKRSMRPINLNIDKNARTKGESKKIKEKELNLVRKMCGEFRDVTKLDGNEEKEEKRKEMEKVRSARSYFKTVDKHRSESMSAVPRMKMRAEEENMKKGSQMRLSQFEPGKINTKFTNIFERDENTDTGERKAPPRKKLITLDQVMKKGVVDDDEAPSDREQELDELRQARKNWVPPEEKTEEKEETTSMSRPQSTVRNRWNPVNSDRQEKTRSLDVPQKLNMTDLFINDSKANTEDPKLEVEKELNEIRESRPTPLTKRWKPKQYQKSQPAERSKSAHVLQRAKLSDNSWVLEKSESRMEEERKKALHELEFVKKARMESLEVIENAESDRPSSRQEMKSRYETMRELEEVKKTRFEAKADDLDFNEVTIKAEFENHPNIEKLNNTQIHESVKCVRFDETKREKEISIEKDTEEDIPNNKPESKVKIKLKQMKQQTEQEIAKLTQKKSQPLQNIENVKERASREEKLEDSGEGKKDTFITRNRSLSRLRDAGQKVKDLTNEQLNKITKPKLSKTAKA